MIGSWEALDRLRRGKNMALIISGYREKDQTRRAGEDGRGHNFGRALK